MTLSATAPTEKSFVTDGVTARFPLTDLSFASVGDLEVIHTAGGVDDTLTPAVDFNVSGNALAGQAVLVTPLPLAAGTLSVKRFTAPRQLSVFSDQSSVPNSLFEKAMDDLARQTADQNARRLVLAARLDDMLARALMVPDGEAAPALPAAAARKASFLGTTATGAIQFFPLPVIGPGNLLDLTAFTSRALLAAADTALGVVILDEDRRFGFFRWQAGNYAAAVAADPQQGVYIASNSNPSASAGCWVREGVSTAVSPLWFGAKGTFRRATMTGDDDWQAFQAALDFAIALGLAYYDIPAGEYLVSQRVENISTGNTINLSIRGAGRAVTVINVGADAKGFLALVNTGQQNITVDYGSMQFILHGFGDPLGTLATDPVTPINGTSNYTISHAAHGRNVGDVVYLKATAVAGGYTLNGAYRIASKTTDTYTIAAHADGVALPVASSGTAGGGTVTYTYPRRGLLPVNAFTTSTASGLMVVNHGSPHGLSVGDHVQYPWTGGPTVGNLSIKGGFMVVGLGDADGNDANTKYRIRYEGNNTGSVVAATGPAAQQVEYWYFTSSVIKINGRPGVGTSSPFSKVYGSDVEIKSHTGKLNYLHEYFDCWGIPRPVWTNCSYEARDLSTKSLGGGAFNGVVGFQAYECYGPLVDRCKGQNTYWGVLMGDNGGDGESGTVRGSAFSGLFKGLRRETRGTEPGLLIEASHFNYTAVGIELASVKRVQIRNCPIYNDGGVQADNPWLTEAVDIWADADCYDFKINGNTFNNSRDIPRYGARLDMAVGDGRSLDVTGNYYSGNYAVAVQIANPGAGITVDNEYSSGVAIPLTVGGITEASGRYGGAFGTALAADHAVIAKTASAGRLVLPRRRNNLHLYSETFPTGWTSANASATITLDGAAVSPEGSLGMGLFVCADVTDIARRLYPSANITTLSGTEYTYEISIEPVNGWRYALISLSSGTGVTTSSGRAVFDLQTGAFHAPLARHAAMHREDGGAWRIALTTKGNTITTMRPKIILVNSITAGAADTAVGVIGAGVRVWGAQLSPVPSGLSHAPDAYARTEAAAVTNKPGLIRINGAGQISVDGIGYLAGAGGAQTQGTSKSTAVTLDKATGRITMHNAALAGGAAVSFTLTNALIEANDVLQVNHAGGGTLGDYAITARCAAGSATIALRNLTGGSLSDAVQIQFALIKGAQA